MPDKDTVIAKILKWRPSEEDSTIKIPDNWHNWVGPEKFDPIIGGPLGTSIAGTPLLYWFDGDPNVKNIKTANGPDISAKLGAGAQAAVVNALNIWKSYTGIDFKAATTKEEANLNFQYSDTVHEFEDEYSVRYGQTDTTPFGPTEATGTAAKFCVPVYFNAEKINGTTNSFENADNYRYFRIILHEIGHTLGLNEAYKALSNDNSDLLDNSLYTVMAKGLGEGIGQAGNPLDNPTNLMIPNETPMAWDILAIQYLYGVNTLTNAGDTTYGTSIANYWSGSDPRYLTIWDASGNDTIDLSRRTDGKAFINLSETQNSGGEALIRNGVGKVSFYAGIAFDQSAKYGASAECVIENATGTNLDDVINGNFKDNILKGGGGKDELYGGNGSDTLEGGTGNDKLYGDEYKASFLTLDAFQPGNDKLYGGDGDDYLDGGKGNDELYGDNNNDKLYGGDGVDKLYGGTGDDTLEGGKGDDQLDGGTGDDTYVYTIGDGHDTIIDADNDGNLQVKDTNGNSVAINMLYSSASNVWSNTDNTVRLEHGSSWRLTFTGGGSIDLGTNFQSGKFGITLVTATSPPSTTRTIVGDLNPLSGHSTQYDALGYVIERDVIVDGLGNVVCDTSTSLPTRSDYLYDSAGNDRIQAGGGNDTINANKGGNDILEGGSGSDLVVDYGNGNNLLFGENYGTMASLVQAGEVATSINEKGDLLSAGSGTDQLYGSNRNDALFGGGGDDLRINQGHSPYF